MAGAPLELTRSPTNNAAGFSLEPSQLADHLLSVRPDATRDFAQAEAALYRRILTESASYIVDVASQLPSFTERTLGEVLKRENQLISITKEILAKATLLERRQP